MRYFLSSLLVVAAVAPLGAAEKPAPPRQWAVHEITLTAAKKHADPYAGVEVTATFTGPGGVTKKVRGYWDGGQVFRVRFTPTIEGDWKYAVRSTPEDAGLTRKGELKVGGPPAGARGFLRRDENHPHHFVWDDGTRLFLCGQTYYGLLGRKAEEWKKSVDGTKKFGMNKIRFHVPPKKLEADLDHYRKLDDVVRHMAARGVVADFIVFAFGVFGTQAQDERYARYLLARYAAFPNVTWCLVNEWNYRPKPKSYWNDMGKLVFAEDPWLREGKWRRPLSVHQQTRIDFQFFDQAWPTHVIFQYGVRNREKAVDERKLGGKTLYRHGDEWGNAGVLYNYGKKMPVVNDEYGYIGEPEDKSVAGKPVPLTRAKHRHILWGIYAAGGYGSAGDKYEYDGGRPYRTGHWEQPAEYGDVKVLVDFFTADGVEYWKMAPNNKLATGGERVYVLAEPGRQYVVYAAAGGAFTLNVAPGTYLARRVNPRTGAETKLPEVKGGGGRRFTLPDKDDWVIHLAATPATRAAARKTKVVLADPLKGDTKGKRAGGKFFEGGGWTPVGLKDRIVWELPEAMGDGCLEVEVRNFDPTKQATVPKSNFLAMWETLWKNGGDQGEAGCDHWGLRVGKNYPQLKLKVHTGGACRYEKALAPAAGGFDPKRTYRLKAEWVEGKMTFSLDGKAFVAWDSPAGDPINRFKYVTLGSDTQFDKGGGSAVAGPVYSNLKVTAYGR